MHLAERSFLLILLTAVLAIAGLWGEDPALRQLWQWPALLLLLGLLLERIIARRTQLRVQLETAQPLLLGRSQRLLFRFVHSARHDALLALGEPRRIELPHEADGQWQGVVTPLRLGLHRWPDMPVRLAGRLRLAWWSRTLSVDGQLAVAPDTVGVVPTRASGMQSGVNSRLRPGRGAELLQLRDYTHGDPLARIDWKTTARLRRLVTREYTEDQHLDILLAIDAGRLSRARADALDRLGLFANLAARFAQHAVMRDDRVGLLIYAEKPLALCMPERGLRAVAALRERLMHLQAQRGEAEPVVAALRMRSMLSQRSLIVWLTDVEDPTTGEALRAAVRCLMPPHLALVAGVRSADVAGLANRPAVDWRDPWVALAAREQLQRTQLRLAQLRSLGAPVIYAPEGELEQAVFNEYEALRQRRLRPPRRTGGQR
jgi:uncharacterized protein (DUF58 family)